MFSFYLKSRYLPLLISSLAAWTLAPVARTIALSVPSTASFTNRQASFLIAQQNNFSSFFEDGRLRSENQLRRPADPTIPVITNSQFWQFIVFEEGNVSFWMPPGTLRQGTTLLKTNVGTLDFRTLSSNTQSGLYVAAYAAQPTAGRLSNSRLVLDALRERVAPSSQFTLKSERSLTMNGNPGKELVYTSKTEKVAFRAYLINKQVYALGVRYPIGAGNARSATAFLNSFAMVNP
jgi:hypothetical protein